MSPRFVLFGSFALSLMLPATRPVWAAYSDVVLADGPIAYWRLDESTGSLAVNAGSLNTSADATYSGSHTKSMTYLAGSDGTSVLFSGGWVSPNSVSGINQGGPFLARTVELWFEANSVSGRQMLFEEGGGTRGLSIYLDGATLYVTGWNRANDDGGGAAAPWGLPAPLFVVSPTTIATGAKYHVVLVMDGDASGTTGTITGYLNGASFGQIAGVGMLWDHNPAVIGNAVSATRFHDNNTSTANRDFDGLIDEVALYNAPLSAATVLNHYNVGLTDGADLIGHWALDEVTGTTAADSSPAGNDGTLQGAMTFDSDSVATCPLASRALSFDGVDDQIVVADSTTIQLADALTISAWVRADTLSSGVTVDKIVRKGDVGVANYQLGIASRRVTLYLDEDDNLGIAGNTSLQTNRWYHLAATWDGAEVRIYVNGELDLAAPVARTGTLGIAAGPLYLGGHSSGGFFDGVLEDVRLYNRALTPVEIGLQYGLIGHWTLDEATGSTAADSSGKNLDGTLAPGFTFDSGSVSPGQVDDALSFNGSSEYVSVPNVSYLQITDSLTIAGWVWGNSWGSGTTVGIVARKGEGNPNNYQLAIADRRVSLHLDGGDGGGYRGDTTLSTGRWYHVAATWDGTNVRVYLDGVLDHSPPYSHSGPLNIDTRPLYMGGRFGTDLLDGILDDVYLFNRALCAEEINALYESASQGGVRIIRWVEIQ